MQRCLNRRQFFRGVAGCGMAATALDLIAEIGAARGQAPAETAEHSVTVIAGRPRERGRQYGKQFGRGIQLWFEDTINRRKQDQSERLLRFATACGNEIRAYAPAVMDELEGIAEGAARRLEEILMLACHEELWQGGMLPPVEHCHAVAVGPPDTTGDAYVAETYDFFGPTLSHLVHWKPPEGPNILGYGFPGLWISVGVNSAGLAMGATSVLSPGNGASGPRVGVPYYAWAAHILAQDSIEAAIEESRRAKHAGWWTAVLTDAHGELVNVEVRLANVAIERDHGHIARHQFGSRSMTGTPVGQEVKLLGKAPLISQRIRRRKGTVDDAFLRDLMDQVGGSHDILVFNATRRVAHIRRTQGGYSLSWQTFQVGA